MDWTNIEEGIISAVSATLISSIIVAIFNYIFGRKKDNDKSQEANTKSVRKSFLQNPFYISLFITSFFSVITFFSLVYSWKTFNFSYLFLATCVLAMITYGVYNDQCPNCNRIFSKKLIKKEKLNEEMRPYHYRTETIYYYSDGQTIKDRKYTGSEKKRMETWRTEKEFYECTKCGHTWDKIVEKNLDEANRPKPNHVTTKTKLPTPFD